MGSNKQKIILKFKTLKMQIKCETKVSPLKCLLHEINYVVGKHWLRPPKKVAICIKIQALLRNLRI